MKNDLKSTPINIIAETSRIASKLIDNVTGDRSRHPVMVIEAVRYALKKYSIKSSICFGQASWIEVLEDMSLEWVGAWDKKKHIWLITSFNEIVDLNISVSYRIKKENGLKSLYGPPMIWSKKLPKFFRLKFEGFAEFNIETKEEKKYLKIIYKNIDSKCSFDLLPEEPEFSNEPILCPNRKVLDNSEMHFSHFKRAIDTLSIPKPPF